ncbi:MAG TPA: formylmethanofuran dehydrogenase [Firmicutes bacterium]|nr:formylmethanofuran dehydrogenase [Bacillota bacterium]
MSIRHEELWQETVDFHGHICPGIAVGFRASVLAMATLDKALRKLGETHIAVCENDVCGIDGVQYITGCTLGNDGLIIYNRGKFAFSWVEKRTGEGIRILLKVPLWASNEPLLLHRKVKVGTATEKEKQQWIDIRGKRGLELMELKDNKLLDVQQIKIKIPGKPRLFPFVSCAECGEAFMEPWASLDGGRVICPACKS